jgi:phosphate transport system substrate-binding protein
MRTLNLLIVVVALLFSGCKQADQQSAPELASHKGPIKITGAYALTPMARIWAAEFMKTHPDITITVEPDGSNKGLSDVLNGTADLSMVSSEVPDQIDSQIWIAPVARMGVVPVINMKNPYWEEIRKKGIDREKLVALFSGEKKLAWGDIYGKPGKDPMHIYVRDDSAGATDVLGKFLWMKRDEFKGTGVTGDEKMIKAIQSDPLAIGYVNFIYLIDPANGYFADGIRPIPIDINFNGTIEPKENFYDSVTHLQRAMWSGKFPCVLTRPLSFAAKGKPDTKEVVEFLKWTLTDGQWLIPKQGYIELHRSENKCRVFFLSHAGM